MATGTLTTAGDTVTLTGVAGQGPIACTLYGTHAGAVVVFETTTGGITAITAINTVSGGSASSWSLGTNSSNAFGFAAGAPAGETVRVRLVSITSGSVTVSLSSSASGGAYQAIAQTTTMAPDLTLGNMAVVSVTNIAAFTLTTPIGGVTGERLDMIVQNATTTMGTITFGAVYVLAGAFTNPATSKSRTISFRNNGTSWIEIARAATDLTF